MRSPIHNEDGMTYLMVMMLVIILSVSLMKASQQWSVILQRDQEAELLFRGNRIKDAIDRYVADYEVQKATRPNRWPRTLKDLTDKTPKRYLQAAYLDPMTGEEFDLIKVGDELHGVRSRSTKVPFDQVHFQSAQTYQAVRFESSGSAASCQPNPINPLAPSNCSPGKTTPQPKEGIDGGAVETEAPTNPSP